MVCTRKVHPDFGKDFALPKWENLDPAAHWDILEQVIRSRAAKVPTSCNEECKKTWQDKQWRENRPKLTEGIRQGLVKLDRARVDLNHDGKRELVYRLTEGDCKAQPGAEHPGFAGLATLMVYDEARRQYDPRYAEYLTVWRFDALLYQGRSYLTMWDDSVGPARVGLFDMYRNDNPSPDIHKDFAVSYLPFCEFRYEGQ